MEKLWLKVFQDIVLGKIYGNRRDEVTGECRRLYNWKFYDLYSSPIIRVIIQEE